MSIRRLKRPPSRPTMIQTTLVDGDPNQTSIAVSRAVAGIAELERKSAGFRDVTVNLTAGANIVNHGLGRKPLGVNVTPSVADATFAWAMTASDEKQATITTVGTAQPNALVRLF